MSVPASKRLGYYSNFRIRNAKLSYVRTRNVAIYVFSSGKFLNVRAYACVKDLTNIMSEIILTKQTITITKMINGTMPSKFSC